MCSHPLLPSLPLPQRRARPHHRRSDVHHHAEKRRGAASGQFVLLGRGQRQHRRRTVAQVRPEQPFYEARARVLQPHIALIQSPFFTAFIFFVRLCHFVFSQ